MSNKSSTELLEKADENARSLSLVEALQLEDDIENAHDGCPECGEDFEEVGIANGGTATFVHSRESMFVNGCTFDSIRKVHPDG